MTYGDSLVRVINFGSLNIDHVYRVDHIARPGETIACADYSLASGGKGANQSIAVARAGGAVIHAGKVGYDGLWMVENMKRDGVDTSGIVISNGSTGHAIIQVDKNGQNSIVIYSGTNGEITPGEIDAVLARAVPNDIVLVQNEISNISYLMLQASKLGLYVVFNPAPMGPEVFTYPLEQIAMFIVNEREGEALTGKVDERGILNELVSRYPGACCILTKGEKGAVYAEGDKRVAVHGCSVPVIDSTGAGDTFIGYLLTGILESQPIEYCLSLANKAAALSVSRIGAAASIPTRTEVEQ